MGVAVELCDRLEERPDRPDFAAPERIARDPHGLADPIHLQTRMERGADRLAALSFQMIDGDLPDALGAQPSSRPISS